MQSMIIITKSTFCYRKIPILYLVQKIFTQKKCLQNIGLCVMGRKGGRGKKHGKTANIYQRC